MIDRILKKVSYLVKKNIANKKRHSNERVINWAIVGTGSMAKTFARALMLEPDARVYSVCSRSEHKASAFAKEFGATSFSDYGKMLLDENIDVVYIATPHKYHYTYIKEALLAKKNVLSEKPVTSTSDEFSELSQIAKDNGVLLMEGMWSLCLPVYAKTKEWLFKIGDVREVHIDLSKCETEDESRVVFKKEEGGGVLFDYGVYTIALSAMLLGDGVEISEVKRENRKSGIDKSWEIVLTNGVARAYVTISSDKEGSREAKIIGDSGEIRLTRQFNRTNTVLLYRDGKLLEKYSVRYTSEGFEYEIREVHNLIISGKLESDFVPHKLSNNVIKICEELLNKWSI